MFNICKSKNILLNCIEIVIFIAMNQVDVNKNRKGTVPLATGISPVPLQSPSNTAPIPLQYFSEWQRPMSCAFLTQIFSKLFFFTLNFF